MPISLLIRFISYIRPQIYKLFYYGQKRDYKDCCQGVALFAHLDWRLLRCDLIVKLYDSAQGADNRQGCSCHNRHYDHSS